MHVEGWGFCKSPHPFYGKAHFLGIVIWIQIHNHALYFYKISKRPSFFLFSLQKIYIPKKLKIKHLSFYSAFNAHFFNFFSKYFAQKFGGFKKSTYLCTEIEKQDICSVRLSVRTPDFHSGKRGSIPLRSTRKTLIVLDYERLFFWVFSRKHQATQQHIFLNHLLPFDIEYAHFNPKVFFVGGFFEGNHPKIIGLIGFAEAVV